MIKGTHRLERLHDLFLYLTVGLGFAALVTSHSAQWWVVIGFPAAMVGADLFQRHRTAEAWHQQLWNGLILLAALLSVVDYLFNPLIDIMAIGARFVLVLIVIKLFSRRGARDEFQIYALSFLTLGAASTLSQDFFFGIFFALYVLTGTFALALLHLKTEAKRAPQFAARKSSFVDGLYASILAGISLLILVSSLLVFFAFPRIGLGLFADTARDSISIAGFSDSIEVGDHGSIRDNPTVVMRVEFDGGRPDSYGGYRWRVMTFDTFDGRGWSRSIVDSERRLSHGSRREYELDFLHTSEMEAHLAANPTETMEIYVEPLGRNVIPIVWPATDLRMGKADTPQILQRSTPRLEVDAYGDLHHDMSGDIGISYQLVVRSPPRAAQLRRSTGAELSPEEAERYLQLPDIDPRIGDLAVDLTESADNNFDSAHRVAQYLRENYDYTLDLPELSGSDPVAEFLFDHRRGHCEYFATAAAVLLRSAGVPTRVVNGFLGGTWNEVGDYLTVRQGDAHAWIEVFVPDMGWIPVEPTPAIESTFLERWRFARLLSDGVDAMRHGWTLWFLEYDLRRQARLFRNLAQAIAPAGSEAEDRRDDGAGNDERESLPLRWIIFWTGWLVLLILVSLRSRGGPQGPRWKLTLRLVVATCAAALWVGWFQGWHWHWTSMGAISGFAAAFTPLALQLRKTPADLRLVTALFSSIEARGARSDLERRPAEGPDAYLLRLAKRRPPARSPLMEFRKIYLDVRFGGGTLSKEGRRKLRSLARAVRAEL